MNTRFVTLHAFLALGFFGVVFWLSGCNYATREERILQGLVRSGGQFTTKSENCDKILKAEDWCSVLRGVIHVTRPEWELLFPKTQFYVVRRLLVSSETQEQSNFLIIEQGSGRYTDKTFDVLLDANRIILGEENRELVAKAFALITVPDYLENEITFTNWGADTSQTAPFDDCLTAWTKIQGLKLEWCYTFSHSLYRLIVAGPVVLDKNVGDYIDISTFNLPIPYVPQYYSFQKRLVLP